MESLLERERQLRKLNEELDEQQVQVDRQADAALMPSNSFDAENVAPQCQPQPKAVAKPRRSPTRRCVRAHPSMFVRLRAPRRGRRYAAFLAGCIVSASGRSRLPRITFSCHSRRVCPEGGGG